jgi:hypothetical protein
MAFTVFTYDVFLSYAHVDEETVTEREKGWVSQFHECLELALRKRGARDIKIWRDADLRRNQPFSPAIQKAIQESAVFVALTSPNYLESEFCKNEVQWFCEKAQVEPHGLDLGSDRRLFNVLQYDIPHYNWLPEFDGANGHKFFEDDRKSLGQPLRPDLDLFETRINKLADELLVVLMKLREAPPPPPPPSGLFTVYVADVRSALVPDQADILEALQSLDVHVLTPARNPQTTKERISKAHVTIHLLDGMPDPVVEAQFELGKQAPTQIIWVSPKVNLAKESLSSYEQKLQALQRREGSSRSYEFMQSRNVTADVEEKVKELKERWDRENPRSLFVDIHIKDRRFARELFHYLIDHNIEPLVNRDDPQEPTLNEFEENVVKSKAIVFFFGTVETKWVRKRIDEAAKVALNREHPIKLLGVFAAPPPDDGHGRKQKIEPTLPMKLVWMDNTKGFDPTTLDDFFSGFA